MISKIAWKNIIHKPLNSLLCIILIVFGVGIISLLLSIQQQLEQKFDRDLKNTDLVIGAKGSPLQLVLSAVYHLDAPTGNIKLEEAEKIMKNPMIAKAIPLAYGDSYHGHRILGTTADYINNYDGQLKEGRIFSNEMETTIGAQLAEKTGFKIGDTFLGTHGEIKEGHVHEGQNYTVVGILDKTNTVLDHLVLTNIESVWQLHTPHETHQTIENNHNHEHEHKHNEEISHNHDKEEDQKHHQKNVNDKSITAVLLKCKSKMSVLTLPRFVNEQTNMQAVIPTMEINRLFYMLGIGATTLKFIAGAIILMAGLSMFFVLYNRLQERMYELALLRSVGHSPLNLFSLVLIEGVLLSILGYFFGWILSRIGLYFINRQAEKDFNMQFDIGYVAQDGWMLILTLFVGLIAALLPAWKAMKVNVSLVLSEKQN